MDAIHPPTWRGPKAVPRPDGPVNDAQVGLLPQLEAVMDDRVVGGRLAVVGMAAAVAAGAAVARQLWMRRGREQGGQEPRSGQIRYRRREQPLALEYGSADPPLDKAAPIQPGAFEPQVLGMKGRCLPGWTASVHVSGRYKFQWLRADAPPPEDSDECDTHFFHEIPGATSPKYVCQFEDVGMFLAVRCVPLEGLHPKTITLTSCQPVLLDRELFEVSSMHDKIVMNVKLLNANDNYRNLILYLNQRMFTIGKAKNSPLIQEKYKACPQYVYLLPNEKRALFTLERTSGMVPLELEFGSRSERDHTVYLWRKLNLTAAERVRRKTRASHPAPPAPAPASPRSAPAATSQKQNLTAPVPQNTSAVKDTASATTLHIKVNATGNR
eukprot:CAMPEP_0117666118 /NCGR_PEP_ID=MMETSP0804-20121206/10193_1 /TAXON_ID=1074897 /ORGANISM="Tetraselmis astigmatica, Strain CCMP880" /LENGTH=382 /DNA_ID=CAMNT_0005473617 /DNA_START=195 /DNA_END=1344 /DNA_ORIENTATION=-